MLKKVIFILLLFCAGFAKEKDIKIYDCFTFFNELEVLKIRFEELYDKVDYFVIVESTKTFNGDKKPLIFKDNQHLFSKFSDKIIHIVVDDVKENIEKTQRNAILLGLKNAKNDDIVFISDADEIISAKKINQIITPFIQDETKIVKAQLRSYKWFLNRWDPYKPFVESFIAVKFNMLKQRSPYQFKRNTQEEAYLVRDAGWHFTNQGFIKRVIPKFKAKNINMTHRYSKRVQMIMENARECILSDIDETYPEFLQENIEEFKKKNFIDDNLSKIRTIKLMKLRERKLAHNFLSK